MPGKPFLSIVIPAFNRLELLKKAVPAVLQQADEANAELIVVDDSSTDGTWPWLMEYSSNAGVTCLRTARNAGPGPARNLGIAQASAPFFLPLDSDCELMEGALRTISGVVEERAAQFNAFFFPCVEHPSRERMDRLSADHVLTYEDLLYGRGGIRELIPVVSTGFLKSHGLEYPAFRCGGESLLWIALLKLTFGFFANTPIVRYRTDVPDRLCTADHQLKASGEMAKIADALVAQFPLELSSEAQRAKARRLVAAGTYYGLAGDLASARRRFRDALNLGRLSAAAPFAVSLLGQGALRQVFSIYRSRWQGTALLHHSRG